MMLQQVEELLGENGYEYCEYGGCFDVAARKKDMLLLKILDNVDSFQEEQANNLKVLSSFGTAMLVGSHTRRERLSDNIIYDRFDIPTMNIRTLENILHGMLPVIYRFRGGLFAEIDPDSLKSARQQAGLSQSELAEKVGITKKSIYEHESKKLKMLHRNAVRAEKVLKKSIIRPLSTKISYAIESSPRSRFEGKISKNFRKLGFKTDSVYQSPFNLIAKESFSLISDVEEDKKRIERNIPYITKFSRLAMTSAVIITKEEANFDIPAITEKDLAELNMKDIRKLIKKW